MAFFKTGRKPKELRTDKGSELKNQGVEDFSEDKELIITLHITSLMPIMPSGSFESHDVSIFHPQ